jgi:hypothetical protein
MDDELMPEPLVAGVRRAVSETVSNLQEVLRFTHPDVSYDWQRMTLYRIGDAMDALGRLARTVTAYLEQQGVPGEKIRAYLQLSEERSRADGPDAVDRAYLAGMLGQPCPGEPGEDERLMYEWGRRVANRDPDVQELRTEASLHAMRAVDSYDDAAECLDFLPPVAAEIAHRVVDALQPQTTHA